MENQNSFKEVVQLRQMLDETGWGDDYYYDIRNNGSILPLSRVNQYVLTRLILLGDLKLKEFLLTNITTAIRITGENYSIALYNRKTGDELQFTVTKPRLMAISYLFGQDNSLKTLILDQHCAEAHHLLKKLRDFQSPVVNQVIVDGVSHEVSDFKMSIIRKVIDTGDAELDSISVKLAKANKKYNKRIRNEIRS